MFLKAPRRRLNYRQPINRKHPLAQGLVSVNQVLAGRYGGLNFWDLIGQSHLGNSLQFGWKSTVRLGGQGEIALNGFSTYLTSTTYPQTAAPYSFALWYKFTGFSVNQTYVLVASKPTGGSYTSYLYFSGSGGVTSLNANVTGGTAISATVSGDTITNNSWNHLAVTVSQTSSFAGTISLYLNGNLLTSGSYSVGSQTYVGKSLNVGNNGSFSQYFPGNLDAIYFANRAWSAQEVFDLYIENILGNPNLFNYYDYSHWAFPDGGIVQGSTLFTGETSLVATPQLSLAGATDFTGECDLVATPSVSLAGSTLFTGECDLVPASFSVIISSDVVFTGEYQLLATPQLVAGTLVTFTGECDLVASPQMAYAGSVNFTNEADLFSRGGLAGEPSPGNKIKIRQETPIIFTSSGNYNNSDFPLGSIFVNFDAVNSTPHGLVVSDTYDLGSGVRTNQYKWRGRFGLQTEIGQDVDVELYAATSNGSYADGGFGSGVAAPTTFNSTNARPLGVARWNGQDNTVQTSGKVSFRDRFVKVLAYLPWGSGTLNASAANYVILTPIPIEVEDGNV